MTALNALLVLACAAVFSLALSTILSVGRLGRADQLVGFFSFFLQLDLVRRSPKV